MGVRAELYPIAACPSGRLAIMPRPRAGDWLEDEAQSWRTQGMDIIVSLLDDREVAELGLGMPVETGWAAVEISRGMSVPDTLAQRTWVEKWFEGYKASMN